MQPILVALVQENLTVGALIPNSRKIIRRAHEAAKAGASIIVFPELALSGYPPEDLILKKHFLNDCARLVNRISKEVPQDRIVIVGTPRGVEDHAFNAAVILYGGKVTAFYHKIALPNYGVFDEKRVFVPGEKALLLQIGPARIGVHICEDSWMLDKTPSMSFQPLALDAVINISASPYHRGKLIQRESVLGKTAAFLKCPLLYCNLVGGQDELVFDGASFAIGPDGTRLDRAKQFTEDILYVRIPVRGSKGTTSYRKRVSAPHIVRFPALAKTVNSMTKAWNNSITPSPEFQPANEPALEDLAEVYSALTLGLRDYVDKNGFRKVIVALSGGIDSSIVATLAVDALGAKRVEGITMPSQFSSKETLDDAVLIARNLGIHCTIVPIRHLHDTYLGELSHLWEGRPPDTTEENLQARIRGNIVMALSNKFGWLVLTTGNKSELATGYCTLYGDMVGGFAVIKDVPKTLVFELAAWRNRQGTTPAIPLSILSRAPSAELRPNQKDTDSLPPYEILDPILERYIERDWGPDEIVADGFDPSVVKRVVQIVDRNEYKRRQGAPGIKITPKAFGRDRRMPITNLYGDHPHTLLDQTP